MQTINIIKMKNKPLYKQTIIITNQTSPKKGAIMQYATKIVQFPLTRLTYPACCIKSSQVLFSSAVDGHNKISTSPISTPSRYKLFA